MYGYTALLHSSNILTSLNDHNHLSLRSKVRDSAEALYKSEVQTIDSAIETCKIFYCI